MHDRLQQRVVKQSRGADAGVRGCRGTRVAKHVQIDMTLMEWCCYRCRNGPAPPGQVILPSGYGSSECNDF